MSLPQSASPVTRNPVQPTIASRLSAIHLERRTPTPSASTRRRHNSHLTSSLFQTSISVMEKSAEDMARAAEVFKYEWPVYGLAELKCHVEDRPGSIWTLEMEMEDPEGLPEALRTGKIIGPGWFKLDLGEQLSVVGALTFSAYHSPSPFAKDTGRRYRHHSCDREQGHRYSFPVHCCPVPRFWPHRDSLSRLDLCRYQTHIYPFRRSRRVKLRLAYQRRVGI